MSVAPAIPAARGEQWAATSAGRQIGVRFGITNYNCLQDLTSRTYGELSRESETPAVHTLDSDGEDGNSARGKLDKIEFLSFLLFATSAVLYGTGFLVVYTYEHQIGLGDSATELFKAKYFHIGLLAGGMILLIAGATSALTRLLADSDHIPDLAASHIVLVALMIAGVFVRVAFNSPGKWSTFSSAVFAGVLIGWMVAPSLVKSTTVNGKLNLVWKVPLLLKRAVRFIGGMVSNPRASTRRFTRNPGAVLRTLLIMLALLFLLTSITGDFPLRLVNIRSLMQFANLVLLSVFLGRVFFRLFKLQEVSLSRPQRRLWYLVCCTLVAFVYYTAVLAFAVTLYPFIPAAKGGGDYSRGPLALMHFSEDVAKDFTRVEATRLIAATQPAKQVVLLLETDSSYFLAINDQGRASWGKPGMAVPPSIFEIPRDKVTAVERCPLLLDDASRKQIRAQAAAYRERKARKLAVADAAAYRARKARKLAVAEAVANRARKTRKIGSTSPPARISTTQPTSRSSTTSVTP